VNFAISHSCLREPWNFPPPNGQEMARRKDEKMARRKGEKMVRRKGQKMARRMSCHTRCLWEKGAGDLQRQQKRRKEKEGGWPCR